MKIQILKKAFESIQKHDLVVNTIICAVCGCIVNLKNKNKVCEHLKNIFNKKDNHIIKR